MQLTRYATVKLRHFLTIWTRPTRPLPRTPKAVAEALQAEREARARNECRAIGYARQRARQARLEGLRREVSLRKYQECAR